MGAQLLETAANAAIGAGMGLMLGSYNDSRQYAQQKKLQQLQMEGQQKMMDYSYAKQLQMWKDTSYGAQKEQMELAGLNPGLMYGMSGGGGQTTGQATANVQGAQAPQGGREIQELTGMGIQMQLLEAQKRVLETQADKNKAEAEKTAGVDTQEATTRIDSLLQDIDNARQQYELQKLEITLKNMENFEKQASQQDRLDYINYQTKQAMKQLELVENEAYISSKTLQDKINIIKAEAVGAVLKNALTESQVNATEAQIKKWAQEISQGWEGLDQKDREIKIKGFAV